MTNEGYRTLRASLKLLRQDCCGFTRLCWIWSAGTMSGRAADWQQLRVLAAGAQGSVV